MFGMSRALCTAWTSTVTHSDKDLIRIAKDPHNRYSLEQRLAARARLKERGYRFIGDRVEYDGEDRRVKEEPALTAGTNTEKGDAMGKSVHKKCDQAGCKKQAVLDHKCSMHFKEATGMSVRESKAAKKAQQKQPRSPERDAAAKDDPTAKVKVVAHSEQGKTPPPASSFLVIDFSGHQALYDNLKEWAESEFRSPGGQIMWLLRQSITARETNLKFVSSSSAAISLEILRSGNGDPALAEKE